MGKIYARKEVGYRDAPASKHKESKTNMFSVERTFSSILVVIQHCYAIIQYVIRVIKVEKKIMVDKGSPNCVQE